MADTDPIVLAIAGSGESSPENTTALLNDLLGFGEEDDDGYFAPSDHEITLFLPAGKKYTNKNLDVVVDWSAKADLPYVAVWDGSENKRIQGVLDEAAEVRESDDVNADLVAELIEVDDPDTSTYLVLLWGDEDPSPEMEDLLEKALDVGVRVLDLTAGLDDIRFADDDTEVVEPEPEPEPKKATPRGRRTVVAEMQIATEQPLEEDPVDVPDEVPSRDFSESTQTSVEVPEGAVVLAGENLQTFIKILGMAVSHLAGQDQANAAVNLADDIQFRPLTLAVNELLEFLAEESGLRNPPSEAPGSPESDEPAKVDTESTEAPKRGRGRPRKDGTPAQPKDPDEQNIAIIQREDGTFRKRGRGRPRKGEIVLMVSESELAEMDVDDEE